MYLYFVLNQSKNYIAKHPCDSTLKYFEVQWKDVGVPYRQYLRKF